MRNSPDLPAVGDRPRYGRTIRILRIATGLVLAVYVTAHLINHALGVISIDAQEALLGVIGPVWQSTPGMLLLYGSLITHALLGLYALWRRRTMRMPPWELAQLVLGLAVPLLIIPHVFGTRISAAIVGTDLTYRAVVAGLWSSPASMVRQPLLVVVVWTHLMIGLHYWLRLRDGYRRALPILYPAAVMIPLLALLGFWGAGVELAGTGDAAGTAASSAYDTTVDPAAVALVKQRERFALVVYGALLALVLLARALRRFIATRHGVYRVHHASGRVITAPIGHTVLEALRDAGIPHASVCGGRARCTTCRVRIDDGAAALPPPQPIEAAALSRVRADSDVRLACQLRPLRSIRITPLLPPHVAPADIDARGTPGRERTVAVMFVDLRESSRFCEERMPYDVFFILNRFFAELADALHETGGYYSTFNGDGLMALYGTTAPLLQSCRDAMRGAIAIDARLARMNAALAVDLGEPLRAGISVHAGLAIVGTMGPPATPILSALGDTVNVAARLEAETKRHRCSLVISAACAKAAQIDLSRFPEHTGEVRGRAEHVSYYAIERPAELGALLDAAEADATSRHAYARGDE